MAVSTPINQAALSSISLEQLLAINPDWLIVAHYRPQSIVRDWQLDPLWQMLTTAQNNQVAVVDSNSWARIRGIFAAEHIALDLVAILHHRPVPGTIMSGRPLIAWRGRLPCWLGSFGCHCSVCRQCRSVPGKLSPRYCRAKLAFCRWRW